MVDQSPHRGPTRFLLALDGLDASLALVSVVACLLSMRALGLESSLAAVTAGAIPLILRRGFNGVPRHLRRVPLGASAVFSTLFILGGVTASGLVACQASSELFDGPVHPLPQVVATAGLHTLALPGLVLMVAGVLLSRHAASEGCVFEQALQRHRGAKASGRATL